MPSDYSRVRAGLPFYFPELAPNFPCATDFTAVHNKLEVPAPGHYVSVEGAMPPITTGSVLTYHWIFSWGGVSLTRAWCSFLNFSSLTL